MNSRIEQLKQLISVTWDGNLLSKQDRDELVKAGLATRYNGWNWLTFEGVRTLENLAILRV